MYFLNSKVCKYKQSEWCNTKAIAAACGVAEFCTTFVWNRPACPPCPILPTQNTTHTPPPTKPPPIAPTPTPSKHVKFLFKKKKN